MLNHLCGEGEKKSPKKSPEMMLLLSFNAVMTYHSAVMACYGMNLPFFFFFFRLCMNHQHLHPAHPHDGHSLLLLYVSSSYTSL